MNDAVAAVAELFRSVPVKIRQTFYGLVGLVVLVDAWFDVLPDDWSSKLVATFAGLTLVMAIVNAKPAPLPPPPPNGGVEPAFPDEFA